MALNIKLQCACLVINLFIATLFFAAKRESTRLHRSYVTILITMPIYLLSDIGTVITVNCYMDSWVNTFIHRIFFILISLVVYLFCMHVQNLVTNEVGCGDKRAKIILLTRITLVASICYSLVSKPAYVVSEISNYSATSFSFGAFFAVGSYVLIIAATVWYYWKLLPVKKRLAILMAAIIEVVGLLMQFFFTPLLLSGFNLTMMSLAFYLTMDNPDIMLLEEVSEEKKKVEELSDSKSAFISVVSHEIRTPMNAIIGMSEILLRDKDSLTARQENYLQSIKSSGEALILIVNDILDRSKLESGKMELVEECYEIHNIANNVKLIIENRIGSKPINLEFEIDDDLPKYLIGDGLRIRQVLINLLNNAVKFTEEGYIRLIIKVLRSDDEKCQIKFAVRDSGQGIKPSDLMKLGQAFTQVDTVKNHSKEGTGLGLSISRDFIELMGGQLEVSSEYGKGSEFSFVIWQKKVNEADGEEQLSDFKAPKAKILFVDDSEINLTIDCEFVKPMDITADKATSGREALELVVRNRYDIIFVDNMMPEMGGIEVTERIRSYREKDWQSLEPYAEDYFKKVPIIALTGDNSEKTVERFNNAGVNGFIIKPVEADQLKKYLRKYLPADLIEYEK